MEDTEHIEELVAKFQRGDTLTPTQTETLLQWYNSHTDEKVVLITDAPLGREQLKQRMLNGLLERVRADQQVLPKANKLPRRLWVSAAAAVLLAMLSIWWWTRRDQVNDGGNIGSETAIADSRDTSITPGTNKAVLILADGRQLTLDTGQEGIVMDESIRYADGRQVARVQDEQVQKKDLQLYVPRGGIYKIMLADGTKVWLNADSRLIYPSVFGDAERAVELEGEAFFEVTSVTDSQKKKIPFIVRTKGQTVEVLGTQFNVNSYLTQPFVKTTLVEGRVQVHANQKKLLLQPGQQATTSDNGTTVSRVNTSNFTAWTEGKFSFDGKSFEEILDEVGRWYNLTVVYQGQVPDVDLVGDAFRNQKINLVLRLLDAAAVTYKLDTAHRRLIIY
ncbi:DUF4974 domain-containing protein [Sphingobacterium psychroaquaticum]|uniref:FecR family protein n=1 Tax=Sphingobacterium psychroaquaticum TaxID=561061 RepID=UPI001069FAE1|nr:FecR family protein [Sphingobacterium psychroaquaticum]QBQ41876.1 DUF4974 domain-containing protein [Sphingobacterium psychroaquaticum]